MISKKRLNHAYDWKCRYHKFKGGRGKQIARVTRKKIEMLYNVVNKASFPISRFSQGASDELFTLPRRRKSSLSH